MCGVQMKTLPCINCVTFSICNSLISPLLDITEPGIIFQLYDRCSLMRDYIDAGKSNKTIDELGIEYEELDLDYDKLKAAQTYFKQFKGRDQCSKD